MNQKKKVLFIVNPISGTTGKQSVVKLIPLHLSKEKFEWEVAYTEYAGHATQLALDGMAREMDVIVAVGGDGTVNEVARALCHSHSALGIVPCGSGNGLARHLGIPMLASGALSIIAQCNIEELDYGLIEGHPFFCTCGVGFDAFVSERFAKSDKRGLMTYIEDTLREGLKYKPQTYEVCIGGETQRYDAYLITCGNASQYGNNMYITPRASMHDGLLDVTIMEPFPLTEIAQVVIQLLTKQIDHNSHIKTFRCEELTIRRSDSGVVHFDGDPFICGPDLSIRVVKGGIRMVTNKQGGLFGPLSLAFQDIVSDVRDELASRLLKSNALGWLNVADDVAGEQKDED